MLVLVRLASRVFRSIFLISHHSICVTAWRWLRAAWSGWPRYRHPLHARVVALNRRMTHQRAGGDADLLIRSLALAKDAGCHRTAGGLAEHLALRLGELTPKHVRRALPLLIQALLTQGNHEKVRALVEQHRGRSSRSRRVSAPVARRGKKSETLEPTVGLAASNGLSAALLARRWEAGELSASEVLARLEQRRFTVACNPELDLLAFNVLKDTNAGRAAQTFQRFLRAYGLPELDILDGAGPFLTRLRANRPAKASKGGPLVSVVVSAYNAHETLEYAIDSLLQQSHGNLEILVCDDHSTDGSFHLLRTRYGCDARIRLFRSTQNQGTYNVRNQLLPLARGELVTFHDADDWALPNRIATQVRHLRAGLFVACISSWLRLRRDGTIVFFREGSPVRMSMVSLMMSKARCLSEGPFRNARFGADYEYFEGLRARYGDPRIARVAAPLSLALWSRSSLTRATGAESLESGYRAPARQAYCEAVFRRHLLGPRVATDDDMVNMLREHDNYVEPSAVVEYLSGGQATPCASDSLV